MPAPPPGAGTPVAADLVTPDVEAARRFYGGLLGWTFSGDDSRGLDCYADGVLAASLLTADQAPLRGWRTSFSGPGPESAARVRQAGGEVLDVAPSVVHAADPGGATFAVVSAETRAPVTPGPGRPSWYELMTTDADTADRFYEALFGLRVTTPGPDAPDTYALFTVGQRPVAGRLALPPEMADVVGTRWMVYFAQADVDAAARHAEQLGGSVLIPPRATPTGRVAALSDPGGAVFTVLTPVR